MIILNIETSTNVCSVALSDGTNLVFVRMNDEGQNHAVLLSIYIQEALDFLKTENKKLDAVAVSSGPGSYTGLRIGVSTAKGLCYGMDIPLISVETLKTLAVNALRKYPIDNDSILCPMIDARRMEVYTALYDCNLQEISGAEPKIIDENSFAEILKNKKIVFFGNGADKCQEVIKSENAKFLPEIIPLAEDMISLATEAFEKKHFVDTAYFEPFYLKEFQPTTPKPKVLANR